MSDNDSATMALLGQIVDDLRGVKNQLSGLDSRMSNLETDVSGLGSSLADLRESHKQAAKEREEILRAATASVQKNYERLEDHETRIQSLEVMVKN